MMVRQQQTSHPHLMFSGVQGNSSSGESDDDESDDEWAEDKLYKAESDEDKPDELNSPPETPRGKLDRDISAYNQVIRAIVDEAPRLLSEQEYWNYFELHYDERNSIATPDQLRFMVDNIEVFLKVYNGHPKEPQAYHHIGAKHNCEWFACELCTVRAVRRIFEANKTLMESFLDMDLVPYTALDELIERMSELLQVQKTIVTITTPLEGMTRYPRNDNERRELWIQYIKAMPVYVKTKKDDVSRLKDEMAILTTIIEGESIEAEQFMEDLDNRERVWRMYKEGLLQLKQMSHAIHMLRHFRIDESKQYIVELKVLNDVVDAIVTGMHGNPKLAHMVGMFDHIWDHLNDDDQSTSDDEPTGFNSPVEQEEEPLEMGF